MIIQWWLYVIIHLSETTEYTEAKLTSDVIYGLEVIIIYNVGLSIVTNVPLWYGMSTVEGIVHVGGQEYMGTHYTFHSILL